MAGPDYGALGATFKLVRMLQVVSLLGCIGMAANFISEMVQANDTPSEELVGTLSVVCIFVSWPMSYAYMLPDVYCSPLLRYYLHPPH